MSFLDKAQPIENLKKTSFLDKAKPVIQPEQEKPGVIGSIFRKETLKGEPSFKTDTETSKITPNIARSFGNIPSSVFSLATPVNPFNVESPVNIGGAAVRGVEKVRNEGIKQSGKDFIDLLGKGFKAPGEAYIKYLESTGYLSKTDNIVDPSKLVQTSITNPLGFVAKTAIEDPLLIPSFLIGGGAVKGKDVISKTARPVIETTEDVVKTAADLTRKSEAQINNTIVTKYKKGVTPLLPGKTKLGTAAKYDDKVVTAVKTIEENKPNLKFTDELGDIVKEGKTPVTLNELAQSLEQTKKSIFKQYDDLAKEAGDKGLEIKLDNVAKQLDDVINNKSLQLTSPNTITYAESLKERLEGIGKIDVETAQDVVKNYNQKLEAFYRNPTYDNATNASIDALIVNDVRKALDEGITGLTGKQYSSLKNQYGALRSIEKDVLKAALKDARKNTKGLIDYTDIFSAGDAILGILSVNPAMFAKGLVQKSIASYFKFLNSKNKAIKDMFRAAEKSKNAPKSSKLNRTKKALGSIKPKGGLSIEDVSQRDKRSKASRSKRSASRTRANSAARSERDLKKDRTTKKSIKNVNKTNIINNNTTKAIKSKQVASGEKYTPKNKEMKERFDKSGGQKEVATVQGSKIEIGDWAKQHETTRAGKIDRFPLKEVPQTIKNSFASFRASDDPSLFRYDNKAWLSKTGDNYRVVYTRANKAGAQEVVGWHKISKDINTYLKNIGVPAEIRTRILGFENPQTNPLSYRDYFNISQNDKKVNRGKLGKISPKQIDNLTKDELIQAIDYLRIGKKTKNIEDTVDRLAQKFGISQDQPSLKIANAFEKLVENTKTRDISGRVVKNNNIFKGNDIAKKAKEIGSDQGGLSDFTLEQIKKENYKIESININKLRKLDIDLNEYLSKAKIRDFEGKPFAMEPIVSSKGEVIDGYNRIMQTIKNGEKNIDILRGINPKKSLGKLNLKKANLILNPKKDIPIKDVAGNKFTLKKGTGIGIFKKDKNFVLKTDKTEAVIPKNQFENLKGQSKTSEVTQFAPELAKTEETVKGYVQDLPSRELAIGNIDRKAKFSQYTLPGGKNYKEILVQAPISKKGRPNIIATKNTSQALSDNLYFLKDNTGNDLGSFNAISKTDAIEQYLRQERSKTTFKSPHFSEPNILTHLRMNERTYKGKKVAFMEELQSDWASELRKGKDVPSNPLLKNWQELAIKRALQEAVNNNAKIFTWINGEQTSARYNLATYLDNVKWGKHITEGKNGVKQITLRTKESGNITLNIDKKGIIKYTTKGNWNGKSLDEVLGKGLADKIMEKSSGTLSGEGLSFGGEWAHNLYDRQVPNIVKKLTGQEVKEFDMGLEIGGDKKSGFLLGDTNIVLTKKNLKVGKEVFQGLPEEAGGVGAVDSGWVITDVLGDGKFKAVTKSVFDQNPKLSMKDWAKHFESQTFNISPEKTTQQGIELTPEVVARIKGEIPPLKYPKGIGLKAITAPFIPLVFSQFTNNE